MTGPESSPTPDGPIAPDGPTKLEPNEKGELVERLSGGTATLLLVWLIGIGAATALLAVSMLVFGFVPGPGAPLAAATAMILTLVAALTWGVATWSADRYIARARSVEG